MAMKDRIGEELDECQTKMSMKASMVMSDSKGATQMFAGEIMAGNVLGRSHAAEISLTIGGVFQRIAGWEAAVDARH
jgi:hypothetical protein